jgi:hypothetical protein
MQAMEFYKSGPDSSDWKSRIANMPRRAIIAICAALIFLSGAGFVLSTVSGLSCCYSSSITSSIPDEPHTDIRT